ncbi:MAG: hypothetical protein M1820_010138 [Bogoriella megaspora]|nr:MAG: hypothetical protein M1820_010138 [Bogoriella megaspora]
MPSSAEFTLDPTLFNQGFYTSVLRLWLSSYPEPSSNFSEADVLRWFAPSATVDEQVHTLAASAINSLGPDHLNLPQFTSIEADRELYNEIAAPFVPEFCPSGQNGTPTVDDLTADAHAALALSILLDQFPRNLYRGSSQGIVYTHYDRLSRAVAGQIRARGLGYAQCLADAPVWRLWFYMSLEHSESVADHDTYKAILSAMQGHARETKDEMGTKFVEKALDFETRHLQPLQEFGRFPWRNQWLGRKSTDAEKKWLEEGGDRFGTG